MATISPADKKRRSADAPKADRPTRPIAEFIDVSDALFVVAAIAAVFAGGLLIVSSLTGESVVKTVVSNGREVSLGDYRFGLSRLLEPRIVEFEAIAVVGGSSAAQDLYEERLKSHAARISLRPSKKRDVPRPMRNSTIPTWRTSGIAFKAR